MKKTVKKNARQASTRKNNSKSMRTRGQAKHAGCFLEAIYTFQSNFADGITADTLFDDRTERIICGKADNLVCTGLFPQHEREDLQQILRLALLHEMSNFQSGGDRYTFAANVVCNYGKNLIARRAWERNATNGELVSLDEPLPGGDTRGDMLENEREQSPLDRIILKESVGILLSRLEGLDRLICSRLLDGVSIHDMEHDSEINITCASTRYRIRHFIRPLAIECGLGEFFGQGGDAE